MTMMRLQLQLQLQLFSPVMASAIMWANLNTKVVVVVAVALTVAGNGTLTKRQQLPATDSQCIISAGGLFVSSQSAFRAHILTHFLADFTLHQKVCQVLIILIAQRLVLF